MHLNLSIQQEASKAKTYLNDLLESKSTIELKKLSDSRTAKQNRALHKFFVMVSDVLNELGQEFNYTGIKGFELSTRYSPGIVKDFFWRPIQLTLFAVESTKDLDTRMINDIADVVIKYFGEKGVRLDFPRKDL